MLNTDDILNLIAATAALAREDGDHMTGRVLELVAVGSYTEPALPLALRYARAAAEASTAPRVQRALRTIIRMAESVPLGRCTLRLLDAGANRINAIMVVRKLTELGVGEARKLVESAPVDVKDFEQWANAYAAQRALEGAGCRTKVIQREA